MPTLHFKGKSVIETHHHTVPHHTFELDKKLSVLDKGQEPSLDGNLIIEGDNLLALKALLPTHAGKVKCVYIDPPYNTGNEGWVYNDNLTQPQFKEWIGQTVGKEGEDFSRHDKWCCMMYPRLMLLKELIREDGSIWISIDDNEVHNLRALMNEVFGEQNFIATVIWQKMDSPKNSAIHLSEDHDYIVVYAKNAENWRPNPLERSDEMLARYKNPDNDPRGSWLLSDLAARNKYEKGRYAIKTPSGKVIEGPPAGSYWRVSEEKFEELDKDNRIWWGKSGGNRPGIKRFLSDVKKGVVPQTLWTWKEVGSTRHAKQELSKLIQASPADDVFITPKPVKLLKRICRIASDSGDLILDSFAGSGTTGHAVLEAHADDRDFVLVQMPYDDKQQEVKNVNLCETLTADRVKRVCKKTSGSFTYAKLSDQPLFGDYRDLGDKLPPYDDIAAYVFYTETSQQWLGSDRRTNKAFNKKIGRIGEHQGTSYYLLYRPNQERDWGLDLDFAHAHLKDDPNPQLVVYCEKIALHRDQLRKFADDTGRRVRPMLVPFNLK
ncbi:MAG: site-specific DNA-methyltransferase [Planctomycetota bacterium]